MSEVPALSIQNLSKTYGNGFSALKDVSLTVPQGGFFALLGPNGAGKSTMIGIISSLFKPTAGSVHIFGTDLLAEPSKAKQFLGVVPQEFNFNQFEKVEDILITQAGYFGIAAKESKPRAEKLLKALGLWDKRDNKARELSGGMKRRVLVAQALVHCPPVIILDEPTAGVDVNLRRNLWEFISRLNRAGHTILLTTHYLEEAQSLCGRIAFLRRGNLVALDSTAALLAQFGGSDLEDAFIHMMDEEVLPNA